MKNNLSKMRNHTWRIFDPRSFSSKVLNAVTNLEMGEEK
jgi:hypothetical protein